MNTYYKSPLALAAGLACILTASLAQAACTGTASTVSLVSTSSAPMTQAEINSAINSASGTNLTVINLSGTFNISSQISLPKGKNCITLQSPDGTPPATLKWNTASTARDFMIDGKGNQDITLNNLILQDRSIVFFAAEGGIANTTVNNVRFINPKTIDKVESGGNAILRLLADPSTNLAKGWTITNNTFSVAAEQDKPYQNTAIMGYLGDTVNISGNTFINIDEGIHYQGLRNAKINNNTGTGMLRSAIELQEGMAIDPKKVNFSNTNITVDGNKFTNWRAINDSNWPAGYNGARIVLGLSIASGNAVLVNNNKLLFNGSNLSTCQSSPLTRAAWERWGIELTTVNATLSNNQFCGFDYGARVGFVGNEAGPMGIDKTTIRGNTFANLYLTGIEMFPGDINRHGRPFGQKYDAVAGVYTETPLEAKARWGKILDSYNRQMVISNNVFTDVRIAAVTGGASWFDRGTGGDTGTVKINGVVQTGLSRVPENFTSHLAALSITNNQINRQFGKFITDTVPTVDLDYLDQRFFGLVVPAIRIASSLNVSGNTIRLTNSPSTPSTKFRFDGILANPMLSDDDSKNYDTAKTFNGSLIQSNTVSASPSPFGYGVRTNDVVVDTWTGISVNNNILSNLFKGVYSEGGRVYPGVNNNTCNLGC